MVLPGLVVVLANFGLGVVLTGLGVVLTGFMVVLAGVGFGAAVYDFMSTVQLGDVGTGQLLLSSVITIWTILVIKT